MVDNETLEDYNAALAHVRACLDQRAAELSYGIEAGAADRRAVDLARVVALMEEPQGCARTVGVNRTSKE